MSHIATIKTEIKDLEALKLACAELGLKFLENQTTYDYWPEVGRKETQPCTHAIDLPRGEIFPMQLGVLKTATGYDLVGDYLLQLSEKDSYQGQPGVWWCNHVFGQATNPMGSNYGKLLQLYGIHKATIESKKRGYLVKRAYVPGTQKIQLVVSGM